MSKIEVNQISSQCGSTLTVGQSGDTVTLAAGATQTGFGRTGTVDWDTTAKTASFTAVSGNGYFVNTTSGAITVTLPAGSPGSIVSLKDYANTWNTNNVTVTPNGTDKINGTNADTTLNTQDQSVTLVYVDSTKGWRAVQDSTSDVTGATYITATGGTITCCGDYKIHTFTSPGTFTVCSVGSTSSFNTVSYLVVAGGGGGGGMNDNNSQGGGGGGAGGFRENKGPADCYTASPVEGSTDIVVTATSFPITVGGGGSGGNQPTGGSSGSNSVFSTITSAGGGGVTGGCSGNGINGGSGGGGSANTGGGGTGNTPPVSPSQGSPGGVSYNHPTNPNFPSPGGVYGAGGGGGATGAGGLGNSLCGANSGVNGTGATTSISATPTLYAEGGGGANYCKPGDPGHSQGSGGNAGYGPYNTPTNPGENGTTNTGGGGGGGSMGGVPSPGPVSGGSGGSGIVIIRYKFQ